MGLLKVTMWELEEGAGKLTLFLESCGDTQIDIIPTLRSFPPIPRPYSQLLWCCVSCSVMSNSL